MENTTHNEDEDNWLNARPYICQQCQTSFEIADQSPFDASVYLRYADCNRVVEVDAYDSRRVQIEESLVQNPEAVDETASHEGLMKAIEDHLAPCKCGGAFHHNAAVRCPTCATIFADVEPSSVVWINEDECASTIPPKWRRLQIPKTKD